MYLPPFSCASAGPVGSPLMDLHLPIVQEAVVPGAQLLSAQAKGKGIAVGSDFESDFMAPSTWAVMRDLLSV